MARLPEPIELEYEIQMKRTDGKKRTLRFQIEDGKIINAKVITIF